MESDTAVLEGDMEVLYSFALKKRRSDLWDIIGVVRRHRSIAVDFPKRGIDRVRPLHDGIPRRLSDAARIASGHYAHITVL